MVVFGCCSLYNEKKEMGMDNPDQHSENILKPTEDWPPKPQKTTDTGEVSSRWNKERWYRIGNCTKETLRLDDKQNTPFYIKLNPERAQVVSGLDLQKFGPEVQDRIDTWDTEKRLDIQELEYLPGKQYSIVNKSPERIKINQYNIWGRGFYIDGLRSARVSGKTLLDLDFTAQETQGLIQINEVGRWEAEKWYRVRNRSEKSLQLEYPAGGGVCVVIDADTARTMSGEELQKIDNKKIHEHEVKEVLYISPLAYDPQREYSIVNLTSKRITIGHNAWPEKGLFVPGFGTRNVSGPTLLDLNYTPWESQGLIQIDSLKEEITSTAAESLISLISVFLFFFVVVGIPLALRDVITWATFTVITLLTILLDGIFFFSAGRRNPDFVENVRNWLKLLPGIALIVGTGVGLPILIVYFYGEGRTIWVGNNFGLDALGRFLQTAFIATASMLPAFLFYLYGRQQVAKQRENFYREAMLLDPNVWSHSEAKNKYDPLLNTVFDTGNSPFSIILLVLSTALLVIGWIITLSPVGRIPLSEMNNLVYYFTPDKSPFTFGFLGAYFFTINMIYRRYVRSDLTPKTYAFITMRLLTTVVLVWAVSILPQFREGTFLETGLVTLAFVIGIFPESAVTLITDEVNKYTSKRFRGQENIDQYSLTKLEGMNIYDQARLMEEGIENIENLAHHNLMELIVRTRIPTARLVDMFDQAILYLHLGPEIDGDDSKGDDRSKAQSEDESVQQNPVPEKDLRGFLKSLGIRTATDLLGCQDEIARYRDEVAYTEINKKLKIITASLKDDEWLNYIGNWRENSATEKKDPIDNPYKFYFRVTGTKDPSQFTGQTGSSSGPFTQGKGGSASDAGQTNGSTGSSDSSAQQNGGSSSDSVQRTVDSAEESGTVAAEGAAG